MSPSRLRSLTGVITALAIAATAGSATQAHAQPPPAPAQAAVQEPTSFLTKPDIERLRVYHDTIVGAVKRIPAQASLAELVRPVMQLAYERSADRNGAAAENRMAILAIAFYVNGRSLGLIVPEAREWPRAERRSLLLQNRGDLSQHFTISAAVSAAAGAPLANAIGLYKELNDARRGSGFSFADLAADRAGTTFGQRATESHESARQIQQRINLALDEAHMMPEIAGLPENLPDAEFSRRYTGSGAPGYARLVDEIERRVAALVLFQ